LIWHPAERVFEGRKKPAARLVEKMLAEDPEKRPTAPECLLEPWLIEGVNIVKQPQVKRVRSPSPFTQNALFKKVHAHSSSAILTGILQDKGNAYDSNDS